MDIKINITNTSIISLFKKVVYQATFKLQFTLIFAYAIDIIH